MGWARGHTGVTQLPTYILIVANQSGNCGYRLWRGEYREFHSCTGQRHPFCGLLQCEVTDGQLASIDRTRYMEPSVVDLGGKGKICTSVMLKPDEGLFHLPIHHNNTVCLLFMRNWHSINTG